MPFSLILRAEDDFGAFTLSDIGKIERSIRQFSPYFMSRDRLRFDSFSDWDGHPYEDFFTLSYGDPENDLEGWSIQANYHAAQGDAGDYERRGKVGRAATAYKSAGPFSLKMVKFCIHSARIAVSSEGQLDRLSAELNRLASTAADLRINTVSLRDWEKAGLDMAVACSTAFCDWGQERVPIKASKLSEYLARGWTLDTLRGKLICKRCGNRAAALHPV